MDSRVLESLHKEFSDGRHGYIDGILVIRDGHVVYERSYRHDYDALFQGREGPRGPYNYYDPDWHPYYKRGPLHTMQSVSKSVTSALVGIALRRGEIASVDAPALSYFEGFRVARDDPRWQRLTLRHLLTMTAGMRWDESTVPYTDPKNSCAAMEASDDWVQFVLDQPMAEEPGRSFLYNSGATELLAQVLKAATGRQADEYAREHLFEPIGIRSSYWKRTPTGLSDTEGGLYLTARDLARIGYLYLKDGVWAGRRVLPAGWVRESTAIAVDASPAPERVMKYGYKWWLLPHGEGRWAWAALGYGGQRLIVVPEHDLVAVFTGWNIYDRPALSAAFALERLLQALALPPGSGER
jgi:CubicO group peptidase (beta-lactamase class C family)